MTPTVAIVGRPNVGKSTLFNRLVGKKLALVDDRPGVTRDRREGEARLGDLEFRIIDTAGLEEATEESLLGRMRAQTEAAIVDADVILFVIDARSGILPADRPFAEMVRRSGKPVILIANKAEGASGLAGAYDAFSLGLGDPVPLSAEHGEGMADLFEALMPHFPHPDEMEDEDDPNKPLQVAIVGRPNAGKSTLINRMVGEDRMLTGPEAGITRDSISLDWEIHQAVRHRRHQKACTGRGQARKALRGRCTARRALCRGGGHPPRRYDPVREAGPDHRRSGGAGGPRPRDRPQQVGSGRRPEGPAR
jgi:GTP-binding protein